MEDIFFWTGRVKSSYEEPSFLLQEIGWGHGNGQKRLGSEWKENNINKSYGYGVVSVYWFESKHVDSFSISLCLGVLIILKTVPF